MNKETRQIGNIRLAISDWQTQLSSIFSQSARLMSEIVKGEIVHFKNDEIILIVDDNLEKYRVGMPMIGNLRQADLETYDLQSGTVESHEFDLTKLKDHKLIKNLYDDLGLSSEYFIRISSNQGEYQLFYEKYLIQ